MSEYTDCYFGTVAYGRYSVSITSQSAPRLSIGRPVEPSRPRRRGAHATARHQVSYQYSSLAVRVVGTESPTTVEKKIRQAHPAGREGVETESCIMDARSGI